MLTLGLTDGEVISVGDNIRLIVKLKGKGSPRIVFDAPPEVQIKRQKGVHELRPKEEAANG